MKALLRQQVLDDESLNTLMCEVESIVNGRPITKVSDDPRDLNALTSSHLLLLRAGIAMPPGVFSKEDNYTCRRWRQVQYLLVTLDQRVPAVTAATSEVDQATA